MRAFPRMCLLAGVLLSGALLASMTVPAATTPKVDAHTDRNPDPGQNFTLTFSLTSYQTANYTLQVSPRPELAFTDMSNGSHTSEVANGTKADFNFDMQVSRSARQGTYLISYSVMRNDATVKMGTVEVKVGSPGFCKSYVILLPILGLAVGMVCMRRPGR
jgi:hypothetical protein